MSFSRMLGLPGATESSSRVRAVSDWMLSVIRK